MTVGLKNEKVRWSDYLVYLKEEKTSIVGNTFISTCFVVYSGPYSGKYRDQYMNVLIKKTSDLEIKTHE